VTNVSFSLEAPEERLADFALQELAPELSEVTLSRVAPGRSMATLRASGGRWLGGTKLLAYLSFAASSNQGSAFIPLTVSGVTAMQGNGIPVPQTLAHGGRVVVIGAAPLLEALQDTNDHRALALYGHPGVNCVLESAPNLTEPGSWQVEWQGPLTNLFQVFDFTNTSRTIFYRARE
jgi:hypothetical protein